MTITGDADSVDQNKVDEWKIRLLKIVDGYLPKDIYNADELGLFFQLTPSKTQKAKNAKFVDNCSAHPDMVLSNIKLVKLPANTTSVLQPCDQGIIKCFKDYYRRKIVNEITHRMMANKKLTINDVKINMLTAVVSIHHGWKLVTSTTIQNCFRKAFFPVEQIPDSQTEDPHFEQQWNQLNPEVDFQEFVNADDNLVTHDAMDTGECQVSSGSETEIDSDANDDNDEVPPKTKEVMDALTILKRLEKFNGEEFSTALHEIQKLLLTPGVIPKKQAKITDFFLNKT